MRPTLRPYQQEGKRIIYDAWHPKKRNLQRVLYVMPTGTGKTTVFCAVADDAIRSGKRVLLVVHRKELVEQIADRLKLFGLKPSLILPGHRPFYNNSLQVASIQTLSRRKKPDVDIVIVDECHHVRSKSYVKLWDIYPEAKILGVTATPCRTNGEGFDDLFDTMECLYNVKWFIDRGFLVQPKHLVCANMKELADVPTTSFGDYDQHVLERVMLNHSKTMGAVNSWFKYARGLKTVLFAVNVKHSKEMVAQYRRAGVSAAHIDGETPRDEREKLLKRFAEGKILVLSNVEIVSEGFDVPTIECVQLLRPTKSLSLYIQQVGRCLRPVPGKEYGIVLDNAGCWLEHGPAGIDYEWSLESMKKKKKKLLYVVDRSGILREIKLPEEAEGMELVELSHEMTRLALFIKYLEQAQSKNHKPISAVYRYKDYLELQEKEFLPNEMRFMEMKLREAGMNIQPGFWHHLLKEQQEQLEFIKKAV